MADTEIARASYRNGTMIVTRSRIIWEKKNGGMDQYFIRDITGVSVFEPGWFDALFGDRSHSGYLHELRLYSPLFATYPDQFDYTEFEDKSDCHRIADAIKQAMRGL